MVFGGMPVVLSPWLTEAGDPVTVRRSWRERLFSRPWRPLVASRTFRPQVPKKGAVIMAGKIFMHPEAAQLMRAGLTRHDYNRLD
jgi:hypothetical protein